MNFVNRTSYYQFSGLVPSNKILFCRENTPNRCDLLKKGSSCLVPFVYCDHFEGLFREAVLMNLV